MILINNYFLILSLLIIFLGTLYPIFSQFIFNSSISIGPDYYNRVFSLLIIPFLAFLTTSYYLKLPKVILLIFAVITCAIFIQTQFEPMALIVVVLSIFAAFGIILSFFLNKDFMAKFASNLSHIGFVFIIIGVSTSSLLGATKEVNIKKGEVVKIANFEIKFTDARYIGGKNYIARQGIFDIFKNQKLYATLNPELRYFEVSDKTTFEAAIKNGIFGDLYLALGNKDAADFYALRIYYKPLVSFIWLGCLMIFVGIISRIPLTQIRH